MRPRIKPSLIIISILFTSLLATSRAQAAACCGGGFSLPSILVGDDQAQFTASLANSSTPVEVTDGQWQTRAHPELSQTLRLEGATLLSDRWQVGAGAPLVRRSRVGPEGDQASSGFGDISVDAAYEILPEWDYNPWKPKGIAFLQLSVPTGRSKFESAQNLQLDITGRGLYTVGPGLVLTKIVLPFDLGLSGEVHHSFARTLESPQAGGSISLDPGWGGSLALSAGYNRGNVRAGLALQTTYEDPMNTSGVTSKPIALERYVTAVASLAYLFDLEWAASASYSDQTLFGSPSNTTLSQTLLVSLQKRWQR